MKAILLCAGYGARLGEIGKKNAKPLLEIGKRPLIEYIVDKVNEILDVDEIIVVSNHKFIEDFVLWDEEYGNSRIRILDDGSTDNDNRLGGLRDLEFALDSCDIKDDFLVLAGDNLIEFSLNQFYQEFQNLEKSLIGVYDIGGIEKVRGKHGVVVLNGNKVVEFQEKPSEPKSTMKSFCCYMFKPEVRGLLRDYLKTEGNPDAPGYFLEWLVKKAEVYGYDVGRDSVFDVGNLESLESLKEKINQK